MFKRFGIETLPAGTHLVHSSSFPLLTTYQAALGDCLIGLAFMMEASTPFVSARAVLELLGEIHWENMENFHYLIY